MLHRSLHHLAFLLSMSSIAVHILTRIAGSFEDVLLLTLGVALPATIGKNILWEVLEWLVVEPPVH